jgi:hypothetical protein
MSQQQQPTTKKAKEELEATGVSYVRILSGVFLSNATYNSFIYLVPSDSGTQLAWTWAAGLLVGFAAVLYELYYGTTTRMRKLRRQKEAEYARLLADEEDEAARSAANPRPIASTSKLDNFG